MWPFLTLLIAATAAAGGEWTTRAESFSLGPMAVSIDLRTMLTNHLVRKCCQALDETAARREQSFKSGNWQSWREQVRGQVRARLGDLPFGASGGPLNVRPVSRHERNGYTLENVLFESLPGMDVNASVYLPDPGAYPPPWPAVVVSVGHSAKTGESYQKPAQIFARCGYVALLYDPPGMSGEKQGRNDHFTDGVRCYATGVSSNRYFVIDGLRAIDYLASRTDTDISRGVAATGVSGGGVTTMFMTLLDDRIKVAGPACCATPKAVHPVLDGYPECPEVLCFNRFNAFDDIDLLVAGLPAAIMLMAGSQDEVFTESMTRAIADTTAANFTAAGMQERFSLFMDNSGHAYTPRMATRFVEWMNRWLLESPERPVPVVPETSLEMLDAALLACGPRQDRNIFTENRDIALRLGETRQETDRQDVERILGINATMMVPEAHLGEPVRAWEHWVREMTIIPEPGICLPATWLYPVDETRKQGAVLYFDDRGRWHNLRKQGRAAAWAGFLGDSESARQLLVVDLCGWGDTAPADLPYDLAGWGGRDRWIAYVSAALGESVMAMRVRDGLAAYRWLHASAGVQQIVIGGHGLGAVIALCVAVLSGDAAGVFCDEMPASIEELVTAQESSWPPEAFIPELLRACDLDDLTALIQAPVLLRAPLNAAREKMGEEALNIRFDHARKTNPRLSIDEDADIASFIQNTLRQ